MTNKNPLIGDTTIDTVQNVVDAMNQLLILLSTNHGGLCSLMQPLLHALEYEAEKQQ